MAFYPCTPGLLIIMSSAYYVEADPFSEEACGYDTDEDYQNHCANKQIIAIRKAKLFYDQVSLYEKRRNSFTHEEDSMFRSMTGEGFYHPDKEDFCRTFARSKALAEAIQLCTDKVTYDGPQPSVTFIPENEIGKNEGD